MASGVEGLSILRGILSLMLESLTLQITLLSLPIAAMRRRRGVSSYMSNVRAKFYSFTPLVFTTGSMADAADPVYRRLADLLSEKLDLSYGEVLGWIRCKRGVSMM